MHRARTLPKLVGIVAALGLFFAGVAGAYTIPKPPGSPGGPPTKPSGGSGTTKSTATAVGNKLAGDTAGELAAQGTFTVTVNFPFGGTALARVSAPNGVGEIGQGYAGRATKGSGPLSVTFTTKGKAYLNSVNGQAIKLTIKVTFTPNNKHKKAESSTTTVTTDP
jgi:hypothetical protein